MPVYKSVLVNVRNNSMGFETIKITLVAGRSILNAVGTLKKFRIMVECSSHVIR